jgi:hypothetical protein
MCEVIACLYFEFLFPPVTTEVRMEAGRIYSFFTHFRVNPITRDYINFLCLFVVFVFTTDKSIQSEFARH